MKTKWMMIFWALIASCIVWSSPVFAADVGEVLYLCGTPREINSQERLVNVDVSSRSCRGLRTFRLSPAVNAASLDTGFRKCFFINSSHCDAGYIYTIIKIESE